MNSAEDTQVEVCRCGNSRDSLMHGPNLVGDPGHAFDPVSRTVATDSAPKPSFIVRVTDWAGDQHHFGSFAEKLRAQKFANRIDRKPYGQCIVEVIDVKPAEDE